MGIAMFFIGIIGIILSKHWITHPKDNFQVLLGFTVFFISATFLFVGLVLALVSFFEA